MNKYLCVKCNKEFECEGDPKCPLCNSNNYYSQNCKLVNLANKPKQDVNMGITWTLKEDNLDHFLFSNKYDHLGDNG